MKILALLFTTLLSPTGKVNALSPNQCLNNELFQFDDGLALSTCEQIAVEERLRIKACQDEEVRENCPVTCGICCENDPVYTFQTKYSLEKNCAWLGEEEIRSFRYCYESDNNGRKINDACPKSCSVCKSYIESNIPQYLLDATLPPSVPTSSPPSVSLSPTVATCVDDDTYRFKGKHTCKKIRTYEFNRKLMCGKAEVQNACPMSCGVCCVDDDSYTFSSLNSGSEHSCSFLKESELNRMKYCNRFKNGQKVKNACRSTCQNCMSRILIATGKKDNDDILGGGPALSSQQDRSVTTKVPAYLALSLTFIVIGLLLAMYSARSFMQRKKVNKNNSTSQSIGGVNRSISELESEVRLEDLGSVGSLTEIERCTSAKSGMSSFVAATVTDLGKETSQADVHKCSNFPCMSCANGNNIIFIKAPRTNIERNKNGDIEFVPIPVQYIGQEYTKVDDSVSLSTAPDLRQSNSASVAENDKEGSTAKANANSIPLAPIGETIHSNSQDSKSHSSML